MDFVTPGIQTVEYLFICICILVMYRSLFVRMTSDVGDQLQIKLFKSLVLCLGIYVVSDMALEVSVMEFSSVFSEVFTFIEYVSMMVWSVLWLLLVERAVGFKPKHKMLWWIVRAAPVICLALSLVVFRDLLHADFGIHGLSDDDPLAIVLSYAISNLGDVYFIAATVISLKAAVQAKSPVKKKKYLGLWKFALLVVVGSILAFYVYDIPVIGLLSLPGLFSCFLDIQRSCIATDVVTGLVNRDHLEEELIACIDVAKPSAPLNIVMLDIDGLKDINKERGRDAGDAVLVAFASALHESFDENYQWTLGRWEGDQFVVANMEKRLNVDALIRKLRDSFERTLAHAGLESVTFSSGSIRVSDSWASLEEIIQEVDLELYMDQRRHRLLREQLEEETEACHA